MEKQRTDNSTKPGQAPGAARLAESEWRQADRANDGPAHHPSARKAAPAGNQAGLREVEWAKARPTDHLKRKGMVGSRQPQR